MLVNVPALLLCIVLAGTGVQAAPQETSPQQPVDTFFAGTVLDTTTEKITVSRVVQGKTEKREFRVTPDTKVEGKLRVHVRVTVRYIADEEGDKATLIVVRAAQTKQK